VDDELLQPTARATPKRDATKRILLLCMGKPSSSKTAENAQAGAA
jgi:hypothetical protein